jgi:hypothetical protein
MGPNAVVRVARWTTVTGLVLGAVGIVVLRFAGVAMPPVPPGLVLLVGAAALVAAVDRRWPAVVGVLVAAAEIAGFVLTGGLADLVTGPTAGVLIGSWARGVGVAVAAVAGIVAVLAPRPRVPTA